VLVAVLLAVTAVALRALFALPILGRLLDPLRKVHACAWPTFMAMAQPGMQITALLVLMVPLVLKPVAPLPWLLACAMPTPTRIKLPMYAPLAPAILLLFKALLPLQPVSAAALPTRTGL
jgi:hypothetical protein